MNGRFQRTQLAKQTPFDNSTNGFVAQDVQSAIEEQKDVIAVTASPGFSWGSSGNTTSNTWLLNDTVPSNKTGRNFPLYNGSLMSISVSNENSNTFTIQLYEHDGTTFTLLTSVALVSQRSIEVQFTGVSITKGKELAIKQSSGSSKNPVVQLIAKGTRIP